MFLISAPASLFDVNLLIPIALGFSIAASSGPWYPAFIFFELSLSVESNTGGVGLEW